LEIASGWIECSCEHADFCPEEGPNRFRFPAQKAAIAAQDMFGKNIVGQTDRPNGLGEVQ